jgi:hypothetical protein
MRYIYNGWYYVWRLVGWLERQARLPVLVRLERWIYLNCRGGSPRRI